jgi:hypothetical protein
MREYSRPTLLPNLANRLSSRTITASELLSRSWISCETAEVAETGAHKAGDAAKPAKNNISSILLNLYFTVQVRNCSTSFNNNSEMNRNSRDYTQNHNEQS